MNMNAGALLSKNLLGKKLNGRLNQGMLDTIGLFVTFALLIQYLLG